MVFSFSVLCLHYFFSVGSICSRTYSAFSCGVSALLLRKLGISSHRNIRKNTTSLMPIIAQSVRPTVMEAKPSR